MITRTTAVALLIIIAPLGAQQRASSLLAQVQAEFLNREFVTKIEFANAVRADSWLLGQVVTRLIDTELHRDGSLKYVARVADALPSDLAPTSEVNAKNQTIFGFNPGARFRVTQVEFKGDRIELWFRSAPEGAYAKLKLMLGNGFQKSWTVEAVVQLAARALRIDRFERMDALAEEWTRVQNDARAIEAALTASVRASERLANALKQLEMLRKLHSNRIEYEQLTKTSTKKAVDDLAQSIVEAESQLEPLRAAARREQLTDLRDLISAQRDEGIRLRSQLGDTQPKTVAQWERHSELLKLWIKTIDTRHTLREEARALGEEASALARIDPALLAKNGPLKAARGACSMGGWSGNDRAVSVAAGSSSTRTSGLVNEPARQRRARWPGGRRPKPSGADAILTISPPTVFSVAASSTKPASP